MQILGDLSKSIRMMMTSGVFMVVAGLAEVASKRGPSLSHAFLHLKGKSGAF